MRWSFLSLHENPRATIWEVGLRDRGLCRSHLRMLQETVWRIGLRDWHWRRPTIPRVSVWQASLLAVSYARPPFGFVCFVCCLGMKIAKQTAESTRKSSSSPGLLSASCVLPRWVRQISYKVRPTPPISDFRFTWHRHQERAVLNLSLCGPGLSHPSKVKAYMTITDY